MLLALVDALAKIAHRPGQGYDAGSRSASRSLGGASSRSRAPDPARLRARANP